MKQLYTYIIIALLAAFSAACSGTADPRPVLVVSIEPQRFMLEQLAGPNYRIVVLMPGGENPETFELPVSRHIEVDTARAVFTVGYLPFEQSLADSGKAHIVSTTAGIVPIYGTHSHTTASGHTHTHRSADPHLWTSVRNARAICQAMTDELIRLCPDSAAVYQARLDKYTAHLDSLDAAFAARLSAAGVRSFLVWHPSLSYFARDYGLNQISVSQHNKDLSPAALRQVIDNAAASGARVLFNQREYDARQVETIGQAIGARVVEFNPGNYDWETELTLVVDELSKP